MSEGASATAEVVLGPGGGQPPHRRHDGSNPTLSTDAWQSASNHWQAARRHLSSDQHYAAQTRHAPGSTVHAWPVRDRYRDRSLHPNASSRRGRLTRTCSPGGTQLVARLRSCTYAPDVAGDWQDKEAFT